jgi:hypothetical protein
MKKPPAQVPNLSILRAVQRLQRTLDDRLPQPVVRADSAVEPRKPWATPLSSHAKEHR